MQLKTVLAVATATALLAPVTAAAQQYPAPGNPKGTQKKPRGPFKTLKVGKRQRYKTIQAAVTKARPGDTVKVANGTYREGVVVRGAGKRYVKLVGNRQQPERVVIEARGVKGAGAQNGVLVNGADNVTIDGFKAQHQKGNGFFLANVNGYLATNLLAERTGAYGIYAFNSTGGEMSDSEAFYANDGSFYIGQTPPQDKPRRSIVSNVDGWGSVAGFTGTNMRYVTITKSRFYNNGIGIVPNSLSSEKFPPEEDNVIRDNEIFWNNFNYYGRTPFAKRKTATGDIPFPTGVGVLFLGGRRNLLEGNRIFGNHLVGVTALEALTLSEKDAAAKALEGNQVRNNAFGLNGTDRNGRDIVFEGGGQGNCFSGNTGVESVFPADRSTMPECPSTGPNVFLEALRAEALGWVTQGNKEASWIKHPHAARSDVNPPLEHWSPAYDKAR